MRQMHVPTQQELLAGIREFENRESRDAMYKVSSFIVKNYWNDPEGIANGLGVLLLTWNSAFYRYARFDFDKLELCLKENWKMIDKFRHRNILGLSSSDQNDVQKLFNSFLMASALSSGKNKGRKSPVSIAKVLHLLAPDFFTIWDAKIARAYGCYYSKDASKKYLEFCH